MLLISFLKREVEFRNNHNNDFAHLYRFIIFYKKEGLFHVVKRDSYDLIFYFCHIKIDKRVIYNISKI